ncbi:endonuclease domain-containing protein [Pseudomonas sp. 2FE]|uniref:endonuclease domain-containing protein n=1 Tax=Pseudomonas sp. 2FE TaxID=2502190 RepID=UPI0010F95CC4|nr:endonuclease domain-containing protein [Pseudomonas sp. 2FE]
MPKGSPRPTIRQRAFAKQLRHELTDCERLLWQQLRNRQLAGMKFRRQFPLPPYVLDFYCAEFHLAIELDGGQHFGEAQQLYDQKRSAYARAQGLTTLRFSNLDILNNLESVLSTILMQAQSSSFCP